MKKLLFLSVLILSGPPIVHADEKSSAPAPRKGESFDANFDERLPPVLPGEEVKDGEKTLKVWSSAGSVSHSKVPVPPTLTEENDPDVHLGDVGVLVDRRSDSVGAK